MNKVHEIITRKSKRIGYILFFKRISFFFQKDRSFLRNPPKHWLSLWIAFVETEKNWFKSWFAKRSVLNQSFPSRKNVYEYQLRLASRKILIVQNVQKADRASTLCTLWLGAWGWEPEDGAWGWESEKSVISVR